MDHDPSTVTEAAQALRRLLAAVDEGEIDADDRGCGRLQRRMEAAVAAPEEAGGESEGVGE